MTTQLCRFGQHLTKTLKSPDSIGNYLSGIRTMLALIGNTAPDVKDRQMQMFLTGLKRTMDHTVQQASPIPPQLLVKMSKVVNYKDKIEEIALVATLLGFYMFLRKSNLVPDAMDEVYWTKILQFKQRVLRFPVLPAANKAICPVFWTHKLIKDNPGSPQDPLLLLPIPLLKLSLSANQLIYRIRKWLKLIGEKDHEFSLHSLCRGGATFAYQADHEGEMIKLLGGWASDCYKRYIDISLNKRYDSMKAFVEALNNFTTE